MIVCHIISFFNFFHKIANIRSWRCFSSFRIYTQFSLTFCNITMIFKVMSEYFPALFKRIHIPYSFGRRIKLIICQIRHELGVTIHDISTSWKKKPLNGGPYRILIIWKHNLFLNLYGNLAIFFYFGRG